MYTAALIYDGILASATVPSVKLTISHVLKYSTHSLFIYILYAIYNLYAIYILYAIYNLYAMSL